MEGQLAELIAATQAELGAVISKPKLTEKLLSKPPFRFLHDVISAVTAATGFGTGLYSGDELDSGLVKEKGPKMAYLDKAVACVGFCQGTAVDIRSAKVVAGLEPENTNAFLLALARVATNRQLDWEGAVNRVLRGEVPAGGQAGGSRRASAVAEAKADGPPPADGRRSSGSKGQPEEPPPQQLQAKGDGGGAAADAAALAAQQQQARRPRAASRAGSRSEFKGGDMDMAPPAAAAAGGAAGGRGGHAIDLSAQIEICTGDVQVTMTMMERLISRPKMSEKLLSKPPFRFLHDIISEVTRVTGFAEGLYGPDLLDSAQVKDKTAKMLYLERIVRVVGTQLNTLVDARPGKIVAGLEPENTNRFLQLLALAAAEMPDSAAAVQFVLGSDGGDGAQAPTEAPPAVARASSVAEGSAAPAPSPVAPEIAEPRDGRLNRAAAPAAAAVPAAAATSAADMHPDVAEDKTGVFAGGDADLAAGGSEQKRSMRPRTAGRRPPPVKDNTKEPEAGAAGVTADPKAAPKRVNIMLEGGDKDNDSDDEAVTPALSAAVGGPAGGPSGATGGHTSIVRDIMEEQAAEAKKADAKAEDPSAAGAKDGGGIRLGRVKRAGGAGAPAPTAKTATSGAAYSDTDVEKLRGAIQGLCQSTNPLGRCMDLVHEDLSLMNAEMDKWQADYRLKAAQLDEHKKKTEVELQPLRDQLLELDEQAKEQELRIGGVKASIARNEERIQQLLKMVVKS